MTERTSERIWRAARAAYESRDAAYAHAVGCVAWQSLRQKQRDIEYDAMVAALEAVDALWQMGPEAKLSEHPLPKDIQRLLIDLAATDVPLAPGWASVVLRARVTIEAQAVRIAELEAVERELRTALGSAINDRDGFWKERDGLRAALKPFAEYAELYVELKQAPLDDLIDVRIPMAWFIAALKAYRGEPAPPSEDKT